MNREKNLKHEIWCPFNAKFHVGPDEVWWPELHDNPIFSYLEREVSMISLLMPSLVLMMSPRMVVRDSMIIQYSLTWRER
jgi:hypothetical protein